MNNKTYRPDIDGLRAIAVLAVVLFHAFPSRMPGGFIGVDIFFVISGYLISNIIFTELANDNFNFFQFYARRICRIFPALLLVLIVCCAAGWLVLLTGEYAQVGKHVAAGAGFIQNFVLWAESGYFDQTAELKPLLHLWSLGIEEQFYIFWPFILWALAGSQRNRFIVPVLLALGSFLFCLVSTRSSPIAAFYSPFSRLWELVLGALLAWHATRTPYSAPLEFWRFTKNGLSIIGLMLIMLGLMLLNKTRDFPGFWALLPTVGASLLIVAGPHAIVNRTLLANRVMTFIGLISYPLYLWHWPILSFSRILENQTLGAWWRVSLVALSIILAWSTYALIERPIKARFYQSSTFVWTLILLMFGVGCFGYWTYQQGGIVTRAVVLASTSRAKLIRMDAPPKAPCSEHSMLSVGVSAEALKLCTLYAPKNPLKTIVLWGDSSVISWSPVFLTIAQEKNYAVLSVTHPSCPPILNARKTNFTFEESKFYCADGKIQSQIIQLIKNSRPDLIVWMAAWSVYANTEFLTDFSTQAASKESTDRVLGQGVPETLAVLAETAKVVVMKDWPVMPIRPSYRSLSFWGYSQSPIKLPRTHFDQSTAYMNEIFSRVHNQNIKFFDPASKICDNSFCHSMRDGVLFYEDTYHMLPQATMRFSDDITSLIEN